MRILLGVATIAALLTGCSNGSETAADEAWRGEAAKAASQAEVALRYWCDPGTSLESIRDTANQITSRLRTSASAIRAMMLKNQSEEGAEAHDRLIALADFTAVAYDLGERATSVGYVGPVEPRGKLGYVDPLQLSIAFGRFTPEEKAAYASGDNETLRRELAEIHEEQSDAFVAGMTNLKVRSGDVRRLEEAEMVVGLDVDVVDRAAECLGEKLRPRYTVK